MSQYEDFLARRKAQQQQQQQQQQQVVYEVAVEMDAFTTWSMQVGKREQRRLALAA